MDEDLNYDIKSFNNNKKSDTRFYSININWKYIK
jgi:hypothetical protein